MVDADLKMTWKRYISQKAEKTNLDKILKMEPRKLAQENRDFLMHELSRRAALDYEEGTLEETVEQEEEEEE